MQHLYSSLHRAGSSVPKKHPACHTRGPIEHFRLAAAVHGLLCAALLPVAATAWCAGFVASYTNRPQEAVEWSKKAIAAGCFSGSCNSLATNHPDPWSHNGIAKLDICSWEGPYDVMYWACKSLQDEACTAEARRRVYQAKYARQSYAKNMDLYRQTKVGSLAELGREAFLWLSQKTAGVAPAVAGCGVYSVRHRGR